MNKTSWPHSSCWVENFKKWYRENCIKQRKNHNFLVYKHFFDMSEFVGKKNESL